VNVAFAALQSGLHATVTDVQWVVEAYALSLAALLLTGRVAWRTAIAPYFHDRCRPLRSPVWCGIAPDIRHLIVAGGFQSADGALLVPGSLALISASFPPKERGRAIGAWSGFTAITAAFGPVLGGWIVEFASWRWVFSSICHSRSSSLHLA
jgi:MFS family permease